MKMEANKNYVCELNNVKNKVVTHLCVIVYYFRVHPDKQNAKNPQKQKTSPRRMGTHRTHTRGIQYTLLNKVKIINNSLMHENTRQQDNDIFKNT